MLHHYRKTAIQKMMVTSKINIGKWW